MTGAACRVILVPPLSAHGGVPSMALYWANAREALAGLADPRVTVQSVVPAAGWLRSRFSRRVCQRFILPRLVRAAAARELRSGHLPVVHVLDQHYAHLLPRQGASVLTCHDLDVLIFPGRGPSKAEERSRTRHLPRAGVIHAISQNTARDVARLFPAAAARVVVNHYGLDPIFCRRTVAADAPHVAPLRASGRACFILHVGSNVARKNIPVLLEGFAQARALAPSLGLKLVKVGDDLRANGYRAMLEALGIAGDVIHLGSLDPARLVDVYNSCHALALPSRYEGFGRPVAEAQACGLPCILAGTSSLPEVGGEAALYHAVDSAEGLAGQILSVATDPALRDRLRAAGLANALRFSWRRHAELLAASYLGGPARNGDSPA